MVAEASPVASETPDQLRARVDQLEQRVREAERRRQALLHILGDYEQDRLRLERSRKAMIHIMGDLRKTTQEIELRERQLREKQEQLIHVGKLATLGELTTGIAHELNNPLNNIELFVGNAIDQIELGAGDETALLRGLGNAREQVRKASEIISHLRTFGRAAPTEFERVDLATILERSLSLMQQQLQLRLIEVTVDREPGPLVVDGSPIQLEQVFINLLTNARDALTDAERKAIRVASRCAQGRVVVVFEDTGTGVPEGLERRIFDPFFTTKEVGAGTGLGLSIAYGIVRDHGGSISLTNRPGEGAAFVIDLPLAA